MGITQLIKQKKQQFKQYQHRKNKEKLMEQNAKLEQERIKEKELYELRQEQLAKEKDIQKFKGNKTKGEGLRRLGKGLAKIMNEGSKLKQQGHFKGPDFGGKKNVFESKGSKPFDVFSKDKPKDITKQKKITIKIDQ